MKRRGKDKRALMLEAETPPPSGLRQFMSVPEGGEQRRAWIQHQLKLVVNRETDRGWTQADIAEAVGASESMVSSVYTGRRETGDIVEKIKRKTAQVLKPRLQLLMDEAGEDDPLAFLFGHVCTECPRCGARHSAHRYHVEAEKVAD